jgi:hypothetical protein
LGKSVHARPDVCSIESRQKWRLAANWNTTALTIDSGSTLWPEMPSLPGPKLHIKSRMNSSFRPHSPPRAGDPNLLDLTNFGRSYPRDRAALREIVTEADASVLEGTRESSPALQNNAWRESLARSARIQTSKASTKGAISFARMARRCAWGVIDRSIRRSHRNASPTRPWSTGMAIGNQHLLRLEFICRIEYRTMHVNSWQLGAWRRLESHDQILRQKTRVRTCRRPMTRLANRREEH